MTPAGYLKRWTVEGSDSRGSVRIVGNVLQTWTSHRQPPILFMLLARFEGLYGRHYKSVNMCQAVVGRTSVAQYPLYRLASDWLFHSLNHS